MKNKKESSAAHRAAPAGVKAQRRGTVPQAVMAHDPAPRDPVAYPAPSSRPRPARATRPIITVEWSK